MGFIGVAKCVCEQGKFSLFTDFENWSEIQGGTCSCIRGLRDARVVALELAQSGVACPSSSWGFGSLCAVTYLTVSTKCLEERSRAPLSWLILFFTKRLKFTERGRPYDVCNKTAPWPRGILGTRCSWRAVRTYRAQRTPLSACCTAGGLAEGKVRVSRLVAIGQGGRQDKEKWRKQCL